MTAIAERPHGTLPCYQQGPIVGQHAPCRCRRCVEHRRSYDRNLAAKKRRGLPPFVDAAPVRAHVESLRAAGLGVARIAKVAGVSDRVLQRLLWSLDGRPVSRRVRRTHAQRLLQVRPTDRAEQALVSAEPTWRMLQVMIDAGAPRRAIARALGQTAAGLQIRRESVEAQTQRRVEELLQGWLDGTVELVRRSNRCPDRRIEPPRGFTVALATHALIDRMARTVDEVAAAIGVDADLLAAPIVPTVVAHEVERLHANSAAGDFAFHRSSLFPSVLEADDHDRWAFRERFVELLELRVDQLPWRARAACSEHSKSLFFPKRGASLDQQRSICAGCPVQRECLDANIDMRIGFWGGTSERQRRALRLTAPQAA